MTVATTDHAAVAVAEPRAGGVLAISDAQTTWLPHQRAALAQLGLKDAPEGDLAVFLHQSQRRGLDPFTKQIYMIGRQSKERRQDEHGQWRDVYVTKYTIQTGIDGYRLIGRRAARLDGSSYSYGDRERKIPAAEWCGKDGVWRDVWLGDGNPHAARFTVIRTDRLGRVEEFVAVCRWAAYVQTNSSGTPTGRWGKGGGDQMLSKCCEALALRMAYPEDFSGVFYEGEMDHLDSESRQAGPPTARQRIADQTTVIVGNGADAPADGAMADDDRRWIEKTLAAIPAADVDTWRELNGQVAHAKRQGLPADIAAAMDEALRVRLWQLPAPENEMRRMHKYLSDLKITADADRHKAMTNVVGRPITTANDLTRAEVDQVWKAAAKAMETGAMSALFPLAPAGDVADTEPADEAGGASPDDEDWTDLRSPDEIAESMR